VDAIGRDTGEQNPDKRNQTDNETQTNHAPTRKRGEVLPLAAWTLA
jgi:hypothetical protein